jgi:tyrosine-protein phosphatase YwqE
MVERSLLKENNIKVHFYYGREICVKNVPLYCFPSTDLSTIIKMYLYIVFLQHRSLYHNKNVPLYCFPSTEISLIMVDRSLLKENNIKVHFYYGRQISAEGKQYKGTFLLW